ncbi:hypothetical protein DBT_2399 [Dissulfuribacter thermophilus]|uniref:Uncharacterized protein n=1 Tax=Dissulfuribacter thermophilus TaxID=1156395 RepID=A0A1B9F2Y5_9BACT|nr:hypothetical protein DBT_2399 [Dissulfuribacter thermophilus]
MIQGCCFSGFGVDSNDEDGPEPDCAGALPVLRASGKNCVVRRHRPCRVD